jgi:hypothetical protein
MASVVGRSRVVGRGRRSSVAEARSSSRGRGGVNPLASAPP